MAIYYETPLDRTFHALGDPTRRRMIALIAEHGAQTAGPMVSQFNMSQPAVSKHLKVLETAALVTRSVNGRVHKFTLNPDTFEQAENWINRHTRLWQGSLDQLGDLVDKITAEDNS